MIPQIVVYKKESSFTSHLKEFIAKNKISRSLIFEIKPTKEEISIDQIREIKKIVSIKTEGKKLILFYSFHKATTEAQNAFLKILEEKGEDNYFLIGTTFIHQILPTVLSRSRIINLKTPVDIDKRKIEIEINNFFANKDFVVGSKEQAKEIIMALILRLYEQKKYQGPYFSLLIKKGIEFLRLLEDNNLSPQLTVDNYLILIKKLTKINK